MLCKQNWRHSNDADDDFPGFRNDVDFRKLCL